MITSIVGVFVYQNQTSNPQSGTLKLYDWFTYIR